MVHTTQTKPGYNEYFHAYSQKLKTSLVGIQDWPNAWFQPFWISRYGIVPPCKCEILNETTCNRTAVMYMTWKLSCSDTVNRGNMKIPSATWLRGLSDGKQVCTWDDTKTILWETPFHFSTLLWHRRNLKLRHRNLFFKRDYSWKLLDTWSTLWGGEKLKSIMREMGSIMLSSGPCFFFLLPFISLIK